ncbi:hypothetical protein V1477_010700 [Vespula maculifrons]|uniref:Uncharacterized protein n=1 Tax=Vespula maculifrons TaxID=7453 RepID=A0ABD2C2P4_VESMC
MYCNENNFLVLIICFEKYKHELSVFDSYDGSTIADEVGKLRQFYMNLLRTFSMTLIQQNK